MTCVQNTKTVILPELGSKGIYGGRYMDRAPGINSAGTVTTTGDSVKQCMKPERRPPSPPVIKKFRASVRPDHGKRYVFHGKANDPHLKWADEMTHGDATNPSILAGDLLNPYPNTLFRQRLNDKRESIYASRIKAPLGSIHDQTKHLPNGLDRFKFTFGIRTEKDGSAGELVNPNKSRPQVNEESEKGRELYKSSHSDFLPGEQKHRKYLFDRNKKFGLPTPHDNEGKQTKTTMHWLHEEKAEKAAPIVSKRADDFRERTQPQLGQVLDPIKETMHVGPDHTFGILLKPDQYGAGDLLHCRGEQNYLRGKDRRRGLIAAMRQHLKKINFHNFQDLMAAFKFYDKAGCGALCVDDLRSACAKVNLPIDAPILEQVMDYCDNNNDGLIDYLEFVNFLNWKDKMPIKINPRFECEAFSAPSDGRLQKQIDASIVDHRTSASMINAVVGGMPTGNYRSYGVPTIRTDLAAPRIKRVSDKINYGDESDAYGLCNPSLFSTVGVYERDFLQPRTKTEIRDIFLNIGLELDYDSFDKLYEIAESRNPRCEVSVESFRNVLDEVAGEQLKKSKNPVL